ncbi:MULTISPECIES: hypothetical protein [unclassified Pseudomonas]|uniref:hypothetical protein n=1 Tax=unclassified Pseudomonas TaxID=196821 RepID=UPI001BEDB8A6|nr:MULTISPECIES: hypothetical protein [unclassified Pseudomonas]MCK3828403.1 hypothetical protein [Pseudomonas sp. W2Aug9]QUW64458.1 hypothetical protein KFQ04_17555 [Pseudomonas synxantha]UEH06216.1 hypothetical protein LJX92_14670 [Pseudomonas sp. HN8-3]
MSSINGSSPSFPAYQPVDNGRIDNDKARYNPKEENQIGDDAEVSDGKGGWKNIGDEYRAHANRSRLDQNFLPADEKAVDNSQVNTARSQLDRNFLPSDEKAVENAPGNANHDPIDFEIKSDDKGDWVKA